MYTIYAIVILTLFDIPLFFSANSLHQFQVAAAPRFRKSFIGEGNSIIIL